MKDLLHEAHMGCLPSKSKGQVDFFEMALPSGRLAMPQKRGPARPLVQVFQTGSERLQIRRVRLAVAARFNLVADFLVVVETA